MIVHKICKPEPPALVLLPPAELKPFNGKCPWAKIEYSRWIEEVKSQFAVGDLVTLRSVITSPSKWIPYYYEIVGINELHYTCDWNAHLREPEAIMVNTSGNFLLHKCPSILRKLTPEEINRVRLSNPLQENPVC